MTAHSFLRDDATFAQVSAADVAPTAWSTYTPTVTAQAGSITSYTVNSARYQQLGKAVAIEVDITITNAGTASGAAFFTPPVNIAAFTYVLSGRENGNTGNMLQGFSQGSSSFAVLTYANGSPIGAGNRIVLTGVYEAA